MGAKIKPKHAKKEQIIPDKLLDPIPEYLKPLFINKLKLHKAKISARIITMVQNELQIIVNISNDKKTSKQLREDISELITQNEERLTYINIYTLKIKNTLKAIKDDFQYLNFYIENVQTGIDTQVYDKYYTRYLYGKKPYDNKYRTKENEATKNRPKLLERIELITNIKKQNEIEKQLADIKDQKQNLDNQISNCSVAKDSIEAGTGFVEEDKNSLKMARKQLAKNELLLEKEKKRLEKLTEALKKEKHLLQPPKNEYYLWFIIAVVFAGLCMYLSWSYRSNYHFYYDKYETLRKKYNELVSLES